DPYRWMEELDSPRTREWVKAEAELTDSYLEKAPARQELKKRLAQLLDFEKFGAPSKRGSRYFYTHNSGLQQQSIFYIAQGLDGAPKVALDPNTLSTNGTLAVVGYVPSPDGTR